MAALGVRSPLPFGVLFGSSGDDTLMEGVPIAEAGPLPAARDKVEGGSFVLVSPSPLPASLSLSFPPFLDFFEACWPMGRPREEDEGDVECGPGE